MKNVFKFITFYYKYILGHQVSLYRFLLTVYVNDMCNISQLFSLFFYIHLSSLAALLLYVFLLFFLAR